MKKLIVLPFVLAFLLSSCTLGESDIKNRLIIEAVGVDRENEDYILTVQAVVASDKAEKPSKNISVIGHTVTQAMNRLAGMTGEKPLLSQNRMIVIGRDVKGENLINALDYFVREYTARADVLVVAADGKASEVLDVEMKNEIPAKAMEAAVEDAVDESVCVESRLYNTVNLHLDATGTFCLPLISRTADGFVASGTYVYTGDNGENYLTGEETMFLQMINGKAAKASFGIKSGEYKAGLNTVKCRTKIKTKNNEGRPLYEIKIKCDIDVVEFESDTFGEFDAQGIAGIKASTEKYIKNGVEDLLEKQLKKEGNDIFRFGKRLMLSEPELYRALADGAGDYMSEAVFSISAEVNIRRIGQETIRK